MMCTFYMYCDCDYRLSQLTYYYPHAYKRTLHIVAAVAEESLERVAHGSKGRYEVPALMP